MTFLFLANETMEFDNDSSGDGLGGVTLISDGRVDLDSRHDFLGSISRGFCGEKRNDSKNYFESTQTHDTPRGLSH